MNRIVACLDFRVRHCSLAFLALALSGLTTLAQETPTVNEPGVVPASLNRGDISRDREVVQFGRQPVRIGDRMEQKISLEMRLTNSVRQGNQMFEKNRISMRNDQQRVVTTTEVTDGRATAVVVHYAAATQQMDIRDPSSAAGANPAAGSTSPVPQAVQGKTYRCGRESGPGGQLVVTDMDGNMPPTEEREIVSQNMEMIGRANPLADLLGGQTVTIGQTISLPPKTANRIFNLGKRFGDVNRFDLTLRKTLTENGAALCRISGADRRGVERFVANAAASRRPAGCSSRFLPRRPNRAVRPDRPLRNRGTYSTAHQSIRHRPLEHAHRVRLSACAALALSVHAGTAFASTAAILAARWRVKPFFVRVRTRSVRATRPIRCAAHRR